MAGKTTDVREWLREQGETVPDRGPIPVRGRQMYDEAHGTPGADDYPDSTTADGPPAGGPEKPPAATAAGEQRPRKVRPRPAPVRGLRRFWEGSGGRGKGGKKRPQRDRMPVTGFVEGMYGQLAWSLGGIPPLQKLLYLQAPFAGTVAEANVRDTVADQVMQPLVRGEQAFKAVNGLVTPPVALMMILTKGRRGEDGEPDQATQAMIGMLRFGLMAMLESTEQQIDQVIARGEELKARGDQADQLIAWLLAPVTEASTPAAAEEDAMARARDMLRPDDPPPGGGQPQ